MWEEEDAFTGEEKSEATDVNRIEDAVFAELMHECRHGTPGARLSARVRNALERMSPAARARVVSRTADGCAALLVAARRGNVEVCEYLVHVCGAPLEQRGVFTAPSPHGADAAAHTVTPLWAAAVAGRVAALRVLVDAGADVNAPSDSGSTPARSACFMTHVDVVRELADRGADLHRPNHSGGTCLINSVQSPRLCRFLLRRGVRVDAADAQGKTALHYAVQEHRADTARLLLAAGADPHVVCRAGDDVLRTACVRGAAAIAHELLSHVRYPVAAAADAYELLGATQLDELNDPAAALASWRRATALRHAGGGYVAKRPVRAPAPALAGAREWRTEDELEALAADADALRTQALLVAVRVLGPLHKDTVFRIMYRGASYADSFRYQRCVELWTWALQIRIEKDTLLHADTAQTACALTRLLGEARGPLDVCGAALAALRALLGALPAARRLLAVRPQCRAQADAHDASLRAALHLLRLAQAHAGDARAEDVRRAAGALVATEARTAAAGDTPLHLACSRLTGGAAAGGEGRFPCAALARLLLAAGAAPGARNAARCTALHVAAVPANFSTELVETLLAGGAHLDQPNAFGESAATLVALAASSRVRVLRHVSLACCAARALLAAGEPPARCLPRELHAFLDLHRP